MIAVRAALAATLALTGLAATAPASTAHAAPAQLRFKIAPGGDDATWKAAGVKFEKMGECLLSSDPPSDRWPVAQSLVVSKGQGTAPLFNPGLPQPGGGYKPGSPDDGFNALFYELPSPGPGAKAMVCRGTILANGKDVTLDAPGRVAFKSVAEVNSSGPPMVSPQLDKKKLAAVTGAPPPKQGIAYSNNFMPNCPFFDLDVDKCQPAKTTATDMHYNDPPPGQKAVVTAQNGARFSKAHGWPAGKAPLWSSWQDVAWQTCAKETAFNETQYVVLPELQYICVKSTDGRVFAWWPVEPSANEKANPVQSHWLHFYIAPADAMPIKK